MLQNIVWPPSNDEINNIVHFGLSKLINSDKKNLSLLIYWLNNPELVIFDPIHFAETEYIHKQYKTKDNKILNLHIGKED